MTRQQILAMPAGRALDALLEQRIFGREVNGLETVVPRYSTSIQLAWQVVEKLLESLDLQAHIVSDYAGCQGKWHAKFSPRRGPTFYVYDAETAPLAVCRAALLTTLEHPR